MGRGHRRRPVGAGAPVRRGIVSYGNGAAAAPVPAIATILVLIGLGAWIWRAAGWPWLAVGAAVMFVAAGLGAISGLLTNVGELSLLASLVATERRAGQAAPPRHRPDGTRITPPA